MKHKKLVGILATSTLLFGSAAMFAACGGGSKHTIERVNESLATCTEGGHAAYYKCTDEDCDKIFSDIEGKHEITWDDVEKTDPLGHSIIKVDAKDANCTEDGAKEHYHCNRCENNFADEAGTTAKDDVVIDALGHDMKTVEKVIPVTGQPGVKAHYRCERENVKYFDSFGDKKVTDENRHELEYDMLMAAPSGWYDVHHDFSHTNDADPYVTITGENGLNVATSEYYTDIAYTARVQKANVNRQFIVLFFENQAIYSVSVNNGKIKCDSDMSGWGYRTDNGYSYLNDEWEHTLTAGEQDCYEGNGLEVTLVRTGKTVKVLVNGQEVHSATLVDEYETTPVKGGMIVWDAVPSVKYYFRAEVQAATPEAPVVTIAPVDADQGSVTLNKQTFAYGDELVITVTPTSGYTFDTLFVNGREITQLTDGTYTTTVTNVVNISVTFKVKEYGSVNAAVTGKKHGVSGNAIADNAAYELVGKNDTYSGTLSGGKIVESKVLTGEYTLKIAGYLDQKITIEKDAAYTTALALEYNALSALENMWYSVNDLHLENMNDATAPTFSFVYNGGQVVTGNSYDELLFSIQAKKNTVSTKYRMYILFEDNKYVLTTLDMRGEGQNTVHFELCSWIEDWDFQNGGRGNLLNNIWTGYDFDATEKTAYEGDGIMISLYRTGANIYALVGEKIVFMHTLDNAYATKKCRAGAFILDAAENSPYRFNIDDNPTVDLSATVTVGAEIENGTVTPSKTTAVYGEEITLTVTPAEGYRVKSITVNGNALQAQNGVYKFNAATVNEVSAEFELIPYGSLNADLTGKKNGVTGNAIADGTEVKLVGPKEYTVTVTGGKINLAQLEAGTYAVKLAGYLDGTITVEKDTPYETAITLEYDMFTTNGWYDACQDFTHQNDENAYVSLTKEDGVNFVTKNGYDQVAITVTIGKDFYKHERAGVLMKFGDSMVWFTVKQANGAPVGFEWYGMPHGWGGNAVVPDAWGFDGAAFTDDDTESWNNGTMKLTLVRDGNKFYAFVNGTHRATLTAGETYATQKTQAGLRVEGSKTEGDKWFISVEEDITEYLNKLPSTTD